MIEEYDKNEAHMHDKHCLSTQSRLRDTSIFLPEEALVVRRGRGGAVKAPRGGIKDDPGMIVMGDEEVLFGSAEGVLLMAHGATPVTVTGGGAPTTNQNR